MTQNIPVNELSDPVITPSSPPGVSLPSQSDNAKQESSDPIVHTLPSQSQPLDAAFEAPIGNVTVPEEQSLLPDDAVVVEVGKDPLALQPPQRPNRPRLLPHIKGMLCPSSRLPSTKFCSPG